MNKIIKYFNQNRKQIILGIAIIVSIIVIIQILDKIAEEKIKSTANIEKESVISQLPTESIITGEKVNEKITKTNVDCIKEFIQNCNNKEYKKAYEMLTKDIKEVLYITEEEFIEHYCNLIFKNKKTCEIENFRNSSNTYTYQVTFYDDVLATGKVIDSKVYTDYITVDNNQKNDGKININSFIFKNQIEEQVEENGIVITVNSKEVYKEYEIYAVKVKNNTDKTIVIDTTYKANTTYGIGTDNATYRAFMYEIASNLRQIDSDMQRIYRIKVNKMYNPSVKIKALRFTDIILDYETYKNSTEKTKERGDIEIAV